MHVHIKGLNKFGKSRLLIVNVMAIRNHLLFHKQSGDGVSLDEVYILTVTVQVPATKVCRIYGHKVMPEFWERAGTATG